jgi:hypothetical protein
MRIIAEITVGELLESYPEWALSCVPNKHREEMPLVIKQNWNDKVVLGEMEPQLRMIRWRFYNREYHYRLQLPYLQFLYWRYQIGVSASSEPFELGDTFNLPPLPNVFHSGLCCQALTHNLEEAITVFLGSHFEIPFAWKPCWWFGEATLDVRKPDNAKGPSVSEMLEWSEWFGKAWEAKSLSDPDFVLRYDWPHTWSKDIWMAPYSALYHGNVRRQFQPWA